LNEERTNIATGILNKLHKPYRAETSIANRWIMALLFGGFVFLFLLVFQPFGLSNVPKDITLIALGYGLTTFVVMSTLNVALVSILPGFFNEEKWNVGRELFWNLTNIAVIGFANVVYSAYIGMAQLTPQSIFIFEFYTLAIGVFPIAVNVLFKESRLNKLFNTQSEMINAELDTHLKANVVTEENPLIRIASESVNDGLQIHLNDLYFIQSADNYVEVYYQNKNEISKKLLRNSLKKVSSDLIGHVQLFRCHKSYFVNLKKVTHVSGNAQGYKLHISGMEPLIPVSRQFNEEIKDRLCS
jgi:DNA-binding LytR/AlgR family response regulator